MTTLKGWHSGRPRKWSQPFLEKMDWTFPEACSWAMSMLKTLSELVGQSWNDKRCGNYPFCTQLPFCGAMEQQALPSERTAGMSSSNCTNPMPLCGRIFVGARFRLCVLFAWECTDCPPRNGPFLSRFFLWNQVLLELTACFDPNFFFTSKRLSQIGILRHTTQLCGLLQHILGIIRSGFLCYDMWDHFLSKWALFPFEL